MLSHLGHHQAAQRLEQAVATVVREGPHPPDLGGSSETATVGEAVRRAL